MSHVLIPVESVDRTRWFASLNDHARSVIEARGLPTSSREGWRFTPVGQRFQRGAAATASTHSIEVERLVARAATNATLVRLNESGGAHVERADAARVVIRSLRDVQSQVPSPLEGVLGRVAIDDGYALANTLVLHDGVWIDGTGSGSGDLCVVWLVREATRGVAQGDTVHQRVVVTLPPNAELTFIEVLVGDEGQRSTGVTEIDLGAGSHLRHVRINSERGARIENISVRQARDSNFESIVITAGGSLMRTDIRPVLAEPGAQCTLRGVAVAASNDHVGHHLWVDHRAAHCTSRQDYRGIVDDSATSVFDGVVIVRRDAQQSEAHQLNHNLLLSEDATVHTKPHLEIDADDVKASHGATVGSLDRDALFYLRSRGVAEHEARALLLASFVAHIVGEIPVNAARSLARELVSMTLPIKALHEAGALVEKWIAADSGAES